MAMEELCPSVIQEFKEFHENSFLNTARKNVSICIETKAMK